MNYDFAELSCWIQNSGHKYVLVHNNAITVWTHNDIVMFTYSNDSTWTVLHGNKRGIKISHKDLADQQFSVSW